MREFRVWAPNASSVRLVTAGWDDGASHDDVPMLRLSGDWWTAQLHIPENGIDYGFSLDDGPARPDPRSRRQPHGVHELSRTFDPAEQAWTDGCWTGLPLEGSVIYELHLGTFTPSGTLDAAIEKLDYLADLGIDFVELLPINAFNGHHNWGYDGVGWFAVHEPYGGPAAYQRFVDACHTRGLGVIQDVVYNHLGVSGNYLPEFGPYLRSDAHNTWGDALNLDGPGSDEVRRFVLDNARLWFVEYHVDGLRLDAIHALVDTRAKPTLEQLAVETDSLAADLGRPLHLIAESDLNDPRYITGHAAGGIGLTASWNDDVHHAIHVAVTGETAGYYADFESLGAIAKTLEGGYFHDGSYSTFRGRHHGRPIDAGAIRPWQLVTFIQDHDQIGNRAAGDRLNQQADDTAQAIAAVLLLTGPFTPMLFMGEEWAASTPWQFFTSHPEPDLAARTRQGRLAEFANFGWDTTLVPDPQNPATFARSRLDWDERAEVPHARMERLYRTLLDLRASRQEFGATDWAAPTVDYDDAARWLTIDYGASVVMVNLAAAPQTLALPDTRYDTVLCATADGIDIDSDSASATVFLPGRCAVIVGRATDEVAAIARQPTSRATSRR